MWEEGIGTHRDGWEEAPGANTKVFTKPLEGEAPPFLSKNN